MSPQPQPQPRAPAAPAPAAALAAPDIAHIGYHRTGTNFLQSEVFPALADTLYVPDGSGWQLFRDAELDPARAEAFFAPRRAAAGERLLVMTHESLSGDLTTDALDNPARLARLNPDLRILVVLRSQFAMFPSLYHLYVKGAGALRYPDFVRRALDGGKCDYLAMVERQHEVFGPARVWVGLYEDLKAEPQRLVDNLCRFLGVAPPRLAPRPAVVNRRSAEATIRARRAGNALLARDDEIAGWRLGLRELAGAVAVKTGLPLGGGAGLDDPAARALIAARHAAGNRRLAALLERPLDELGYPA